MKRLMVLFNMRVRWKSGSGVAISLMNIGRIGILFSLSSRNFSGWANSWFICI